MTKHRAGRWALRCLGLDFKDRARRAVREQSAELDREAVARLSRGSVGAQLLDFTTKEELEQEREEIRRLDFAS